MWWLLIALLPFVYFSGWIIYFSILAIYRAFPEMVLGHGAEVLLALPFAVACIGIEIYLVLKLRKYKLSGQISNGI